MENASKALIIAGEILITVLILSLASYTIVQFGSFSKNLNKQMSESEVRTYNANFTVFSGRANITIQEIASIVNFAKQHNFDNELESASDSELFVDVCIGDRSILNEDINKLLENNKYKYYSCNIRLSQISVNDEKTIISAKRNTYNTDIVYNKSTEEYINKIIFHEIVNEDYTNALRLGASIEWKN